MTPKEILKNFVGVFSIYDCKFFEDGRLQSAACVARGRAGWGEKPGRIRSQSLDAEEQAYLREQKGLTLEPFAAYMSREVWAFESGLSGLLLYLRPKESGATK